MINTIFTIYDQKAEAFLPPFFLPKDAMAIRTFSDCVNAKDHQFSNHPEDYSLTAIGTWDEQEGTIRLYDIPKTLANGLDLKKSED